MKKMIPLLVIALLLGILPGRTFAVESSAESKNILFFGNSKTYYNNLPEKVEKFANKDTNPNTPQLSQKNNVIPGGELLKDHYKKLTGKDGLKEILITNESGISKPVYFSYLVLQEAREVSIHNYDRNKNGMGDYDEGAFKIIEYLLNNKNIDKNTIVIITAVQPNSEFNKTKVTNVNKNSEKIRDVAKEKFGMTCRVAYTNDALALAKSNKNTKYTNSVLFYDDLHLKNIGTYLQAAVIYETLFGVEVKDYSGEYDINKYDEVSDLPYRGMVTWVKRGSESAVSTKDAQKTQYIARLMMEQIVTVENGFDKAWSPEVPENVTNVPDSEVPENMNNVTNNSEAVENVTNIPDNSEALVNNEKKLNTLFIGNGRTYFNDLPKLVNEFAKLDNDDSTLEMDISVVAEYNAKLSETYKTLNSAGNAAKAKQWDVVVLQEQIDVATDNYKAYSQASINILKLLQKSGNITDETLIILNASHKNRDKNEANQKKINQNTLKLKKSIESSFNNQVRIAYAGQALIDATKSINKIKLSKLFSEAYKTSELGAYIEAGTIYSAIFDKQLKIDDSKLSSDYKKALKVINESVNKNKN